MTITVAVVGCGRWGSVHLASLAEMKSSGQVDRVIACDVNEAALNNVVGADATYSSVDEMVGAETPNLTIIAAPNSTHYPLGMAIIKNGLNLLIEKPFAPNPDAAADLIQEALKYGCTVSSGHLLRHHPGFQQAKHIILSGEIGEITQAMYVRKTVRPMPTSADVVEGLASHGIDALEYFFPKKFEFSSIVILEQGADHLSIEAHTPLLPGTSLIKGGIDVAWGAEKEERLLQMVGVKGHVEVDFSQHKTISVNGEERLLNNQTTPLIAQVQDALQRNEMTAEFNQSLINTISNVAMTKSAMSSRK